jgi:hypothetical protein
LLFVAVAVMMGVQHLKVLVEKKKVYELVAVARYCYLKEKAH